MEDESLPSGGLKIALVERLTGVGVHTLRAWERRYGVPRPARTLGRQRLYTVDDVALVKRMHALAEAGIALQRAAQTALAELDARQAARPGDSAEAWTRTRFLDALARYDERDARDAWLEAVERRDVVTALEEMVVPTLIDIGDAWHAGRMTEAQEHFASAFIRARLDSLGRSVQPLDGAPVVLLACGEGEQHELGLLMVTVLARFQGLATVYLGQDLPAAALEKTAMELNPPVICLSASTEPAVNALVPSLRRLRAALPGTPILVGGRAFGEPGRTLAVEGVELAPARLSAAVERIARICRPHERPRGRTLAAEGSR